MNKKDCHMAFEIDGILVCAFDFINEKENIQKECSSECELKQAQHHNNNQRRWYKR